MHLTELIASTTLSERLMRFTLSVHSQINILSATNYRMHLDHRELILLRSGKRWVIRVNLLIYIVSLELVIPEI